jgi:RHS repeat-associated protein
VPRSIGKIAAKKNAAGAIESVEVTLHATEQLSPSSLPAGARLAVVDANGSVLLTATTPAAIAPDDPYAVRWTLNASEWHTLTAAPAAHSLSIAATSELRASTWSSDVPVMPAPEWAQATGRAYSSPELPVEVREPLQTLASFVDAIPSGQTRTTTPYEVDALSLLGLTGTDTPLDDILSARFHAHPFTDPLTKLNYARARWYDLSSGSFLNPDPKGFVDSSNLYSFAGSDPVNRRDPSGNNDYLTAASGYIVGALEWGKDLAVGVVDEFGYTVSEILYEGSGARIYNDEHYEYMRRLRARQTAVFAPVETASRVVGQRERTLGRRSLEGTRFKRHA